MNKAKFLLSGFFLSICLLSAPWQALAQTGENCPSDTVCITNPLGKINSFQELIGVVINNIMGIIGSIALVMFIAGGLIWLTSGGNATKVKQGKDIIIWAALGLALIFSSYALVRFVIELA
jgi:hypothetical protein